MVEATIIAVIAVMVLIVTAVVGHSHNNESNSGSGNNIKVAMLIAAILVEVGAPAAIMAVVLTLDSWLMVITHPKSLSQSTIPITG